MSTTENKMHPMMIVAATSVTVASLVAVASMTGFLPGKTAPATETTAASSPAPLASAEADKIAPPVAKAAPETISEVKPKKVQKEKTAKSSPASSGDSKSASEQSSTQQGSANPAQESNSVVSAAICNECGVVEGVRETKVKGEGSGLGAIAGGVLGGLLGNQVGRGTGKTVATVAAAAGGAYAGHQIERNMGGEKQVEVTVRFDDGSIRTLPQQTAGRWHQGDRVRMNNGQLLPN